MKSSNVELLGLVKFLHKNIPECSNGEHTRIVEYLCKTFPNGQMLSERLCKNKNKEVLKCKKSKTKFKQKEDFKNVKAKKIIIVPLIRNRKRCKERLENN